MKETAEFVPSKVKSRMKEIHFRTTALLHEALNEIKNKQKKIQGPFIDFFQSRHVKKYIINKEVLGIY